MGVGSRERGAESREQRAREGVENKARQGWVHAGRRQSPTLRQGARSKEQYLVAVRRAVHCPGPMVAVSWRRAGGLAEVCWP